MIVRPARSIRLSESAKIAQFIRFTVVGTVGFCIDAFVLVVAVHVGVNPISGRFVSFAIAVMATYVLNRTWAFRDSVGFLRGLQLYVGVQSVGFLCNFVSYSALYVGLPTPWNAPAICLAIASALALVVNYVGAELIVFRRPGVERSR